MLLFSSSFFVQLHGTYRRKDRVYDENIFYGKGLALDEVSEEVLLKDIEQRKSENPLAYKSNTNENSLDELGLLANLKSAQKTSQ